MTASARTYSTFVGGATFPSSPFTVPAQLYFLITLCAIFRHLMCFMCNLHLSLPPGKDCLGIK